jgi:CubicO group peptidase (beta-lactamase class C family)
MFRLPTFEKKFTIPRLQTFFNALLLLISFSTFCIAQDMEKKVDEYIEAHIKNGTFSGSILIAHDGKVLLNKGYGMANIENDVPNTPETKFRLGSVTKQFTALAIMQLQEKGLLTVDEPLSKFIPDYPNGEKITIHHLLTHTSGIPNITDLSELQNIKMLNSPVEKTIEVFKHKPLEFTPGEKYQYSNSGYILLGYIIEKVSGKSYEAYLKENIFDPLDMKDSGYDHYRTILKHRAAGYFPGKDDVVNAEYIDMSIPHGGGGLYSTIKDMYRWDRALYTEKLVKKSSLDKMFTPFKNDYGYGWKIEQQFNRNCIRHAGGIEGFAAQISRYPDDNACVIVLSNFQHATVNDIGRDLAAILFGEKYELPAELKVVEIDPCIYDAYVGTYEFEPENVINVTKQDNRLFIAPPGQPEVEIFPLSETQFLVKAFDAEITFVKIESGEVTKLIFHVGGNDMAAKKIK